MPAPPLLQAQPTPLLGRMHELETIRQRLVDDTVRLLTLTGPAGVGKTRLALEAGTQLADAFPDGVILVDLTLVRDPSQVLPTMAQALGITDRNNHPLQDRLEESLRDRNLLLILENFERVLPAASQLAELLATCLGVAFLVTSRVPLHLRWEQTLRIPPLPVPDLIALPSLDQLVTFPSIALFLERIKAINPDFTFTDDNAQAVAELCVRLDGLPLAIELAAARTPLLSPQMILERWEQRLSLLHWEALDLPARQHTLGSAIGWSYDLLSEEEQALFRQLGVFVDGFALEAAEAIVAGSAAPSIDVLEGLGSLIDKSLIQVKGQEEGHVRYTLLESMREYAWEQLDHRSELDAAARAHAQYFLELAERADPQLRTHSQPGWYSRLEQERDNLRVALRWLLDHDEHEMALRLAAALGYFWWTRGNSAEGWRWLKETLRKAQDAAPAIRTKALLWAGLVLINEGDLDRSRDVLEEAIHLARQRHDRSDIAQSLTFLGGRATVAGEWADSARLLQEALGHWEELGDPFQIGLTLFYQGAASLMQGDYQHAALLYSDALARFEATGNVRLSSAMRLYLALAVLQLGDLARAVQLVQEGVQVGVAFQERWHLTLGVDAALLLIGDRAEPEQRARLLGARGTLRQAPGFAHSLWERFSGQSVTTLREQLERDGWGAAYQEGRSLSFEDVATLTLAMLKDFSQMLADPRTTGEHPSQESLLTERELEVLHLVAGGLSSKAIGTRLIISVSTVNYHLTSIFNKLGVDSRAQAVAVAAQHGLL